MGLGLGSIKSNKAILWQLNIHQQEKFTKVIKEVLLDVVLTLQSIQITGQIQVRVLLVIKMDVKINV